MAITLEQLFIDPVFKMYDLPVYPDDGKFMSLVVPIKCNEEQLKEQYARYVKNINPNDEVFYSCFEEFRDNYEREWKAKEDQEKTNRQILQDAQRKLTEKWRREQEEFERQQKIRQEVRRQREEARRQRELETLKRNYEREFGKPEEVKKIIQPTVHESVGKRLIKLD
jgi:hypothetical protein